MSQSKDADQLGFWEHLEVLRHCLFRILAVTLVAGIVAFCFKNLLFSVVLAPKSPDFITYRLFERLVGPLQPFQVDLINIELAQQFILHMKMAFWMGFIVVSPYVIYVLFGFVAPALYESERRHAVKAVAGGYVMFLLGVLLNYFLIFPLTFRFLGTYQVDPSVTNVISLESYISILLMLSLTMGVIFELPVLCWLLAKLGMMKAAFMKKYRRHAIVVVLVVAAIITPTGDAFTLTLVSLPIYLLFELSVLIVKRTERKSIAQSERSPAAS
ncbi:MAG: twin-arginine translocase subunit TatC [Bacteroidales bacterium]|nr:twin-arginine translocase subunit TatC [Bacteroidales bacterium]